MRRRRFFALGLGAAACVAASAAGCGAEQAPGAGARPGGAAAGRFVVAPAGRRWDRMCGAFVRAARESGFQVAEGTGGTAITFTGLPALAVAQLNGTRTPLETATPLSRLAAEIEVVVVAAGSRFRDFDDLGARLRADPAATLLAGGPQGEPGHLLFGLIAKGLGADTRKVDYTGYATGDEVVAALLSGRAAAAAGSLADWRPAIAYGRVRPLAVSTASRVEGLDVPTLLECGVRVDFGDWCAAFGPQGMSRENRETAVALFDTVTSSRRWEAACRAGGWEPIPLSGDDLRRWLASESQRTYAILGDLGLIDAAKNTTCWVGCANGH
ncbi:Bug family tripartite tricarboxylate transporter substrate binding protein [Nonomuraea pusilla]|uniref:Putative tricarboxylic transport membrane protein n=1 Tax=Nonomuraea pusilla TaxID=46177 RepID=A0A1H7KMB3_9ACTN|nr:tripartite tricarboxylate transporter substrate-binding protein [Nonomuraea pusilla]SEK87656.1 putative tricarboxylic transport membrane protein [Nonomuraea pusilla]